MSGVERQEARRAVKAAQAQYERERAKAKQAREARRRAFAEAQESGLTVRQIAAEVGLHYSRVAEIIQGK